MRRANVTLAAVAAAVLFLLVFGKTLANLYLDSLWFQSLGHGDVFVAALLGRLFSGAAAGAGAAVFLLLNASAARALRPRGAFRADNVLEIPNRGRAEPYLNPLFIGGALIVALLVGLGAASRWDLFYQWSKAVPFGREDPLFGLDLSFYLLKLPAVDYGYGLAMSVLVLGALVAAAGHAVFRGVQITPGGAHVTPGARAHAAALFVLFFLLKAFGYRLAMYGLLHSSRGVVNGASYADVAATLPALKGLAVLSLFCALLAAVNFFTLSWKPIAAAAVALAIGSAAGGSLLPQFVQNFSVKVNEPERERPFILRNIEFTRLALGLNVSMTERPVSRELERGAIERNRIIIDNIRLWDDEAALSAIKPQQELQPYYTIESLDVDRYEIDGVKRQVAVAARELDYTRLPNPSWPNLHLSYTHGYGLAMSPVSKATEEGLPDYLIKDIPVQSPHFDIKRPEIYFGERDDPNDYVFVRKNDAGNPENSYRGKDGVPLNGLFRKALYAWRFNSLAALLNTSIGPDSRILYDRSVHRRLVALMPMKSGVWNGDAEYLRRVAASVKGPVALWDVNSYLVAAGGRLKWIVDGYVVAPDFPYSGRRLEDGSRMNAPYIRNSIKAVVDAYDGDVNLYVSDGDDPVVQTWRSLFPKLFQPLSAMPAELRDHIRYPIGLFQLQAEGLRMYHVDDPLEFYKGSRQWNVAQRQFNDRAKGPMRPYYGMMKLPGEEEAEFILMLPFTPLNKDIMTAWLCARSDGEHYGKLVAYTFPNDTTVYGPLQIEGKIDKNTEISAAISLWAQKGSNVNRGALLVVPIEDTALYVEPIYLQSEQAGFAELRRVIVAFGDRVAWAATLDGAIDRLFSGAERISWVSEMDEGDRGKTAPPAPPSERETGSGGTVPEPAAPSAAEGAGPLSADSRLLLREALAHWEKAKQAHAKGDFEAYGRNLQEADRRFKEIEKRNPAEAGE